MNLPILGKAEPVGNPECPIIWRWTLVGEGKTEGDRHWWRFMPFKVMLHYFPPRTADLDVHDHPRSFMTFMLRGSYKDVRPDGSEILRAPAVRYRAAEHAHRTVTGARGAWTLVIMGPLKRPWGFWLDGKWRPWREYVAMFGNGGRRC